MSAVPRRRNPRPQRSCFCPKCSSTSRGYQSVSDTTWSRHNPAGKPPYPPRLAGRPPPPLPLSPPRLSRPASLLQEANSQPSVVLEQQADRWNDQFGDEYFDLGGESDGSDGGYGGGSAEVEQFEPRDEIEPEDAAESMIEDDTLVEPDDLSEAGVDLENDIDGTPRVILKNFNRHHDLEPAIRHLYTVMAFGKAKGLSNHTSNTFLEQMTAGIELATGEEVDTKTSNIRTAMSRLGVLPDEYMNRFIVCPNPDCWNLTAYDRLYLLDRPICGSTIPESRRICETAIYKMEAGRVRIPFKVMPFCKLSTWLGLLLQDDNVRRNLNTWRLDPETRPDDWKSSDQTPPLPRDQPYFHEDVPLQGLSDGSAWRSGWADAKRTVWDDNRVTEDIDPELVEPGHPTTRHSSLQFGLKIVVNLDWFAVKGVVGSSIGVMYASIANLPRDLCFKRRYTALLMVIPGPKEPSRTCFSRILEPVVNDIQFCERGFRVLISAVDRVRPPGAPRHEIYVQARVLLNASDLPATRKLAGTVGHSHKHRPCHHCNLKKEEINEPTGYLHEEFVDNDPGEHLRAAFEYEIANEARRAEIEQEYGVRFSPMARLLGYDHSATNPPDPLHNSFLGISKRFVNLIFEMGLFDGDDPAITDFRQVFETSQYPGHLGRLPKRITKQFATISGKKAAGGGLKADQWKRVMQLLPVALYNAWRCHDSDDISQEPLDEQDGDAPGPSRLSWFQAAISLCCGIRTLHSHEISLNTANAAVRDISSSATAILAMGGRLTINWHLAMHYPKFVMMYGPLTGFGTWAFERNNGALAKINHNGLERDVASTCLRIWLLEFLLAAKISNPAPDATITEKAALETLLTDKAAVQGTLMLEEARGNAANHQIRLPTPLEKGHVIDLQRFHAYRPLLEYVQTNYPQYGFADAAYVMGDAPCLPVRSTAYKIYTHAVYTGFKFCSELYSRTRSDQYALASRSVGDPNGPRHLCRLKLFLSIRLRVDHIREPLQLTLALVEFLEEAKGLYPWQYRSIDLGIRIYRRIFKRSTFIPIDNMKASTIVTPLQTHADGPCLVSTSCEKDGVEPEFWLNADADQDVDEDADVDDQEF